MAIKGVEIGQEFRFAKTVGETDVTLFAGLTGDFSDTHINEQYMQEKSSIGTRIAHGALIVGYMSRPPPSASRTSSIAPISRNSRSRPATTGSASSARCCSATPSR
ncbi:MaoC/PaaZ C-terminal domain-containing protein [Burkholderia gladioli]|uniref:MaoC/PaaZ C-terminal domain-containing protein n=1 Tax=Burkholderia gladioli TaxID=28095 RepID=UPI003B982E75